MKKQRGVTLIALIITIIVLLILAGITINAIVGDNSILGKSKKASEKTNLAKEDEEQKIEKYEELMDKYEEGTYSENTNLPANTKDTPAGTKVKIPTYWNNEIATVENGKVIENVKQVATVEAIAVGNGETVPVPKGFYYVGGNLETGVVISDNEADKYDGVTDKTTYEYTTKLIGNQFVWIPRSKNEYVKENNWGKSNANWSKITPSSEYTQIEKYGGFYVGRYEAGLSKNISEFTTTQTHTGSNNIYNKIEVPQSKAGAVPWNFISWNNAKASAEKMYEGNKYVNSGLITGTQWDVMLKTLMKDKTRNLTTADMTNSSKWGNYANSSTAFKGRYATSTLTNGTWKQEPFTKEVTEGVTGTYTTYTTGASEKTKVYNIFDVAGNVWEWTEEDSFYNTSGEYRVLRGRLLR